MAVELANASVQRCSNRVDVGGKVKCPGGVSGGPVGLGRDGAAWNGEGPDDQQKEPVNRNGDSGDCDPIVNRTVGCLDEKRGGRNEQGSRQYD